MMFEFKTKELEAQLKALPVPTTLEEANMQREQLLTWKLQIDTDMQEIDQQISTAKAKAYQGEYSDPDWFRRANHASRMKKLQSQKIQNHLTKLKRLRHELSEAERPTPHRSVRETMDRVHAITTEEAESPKPPTWFGEVEIDGKEVKLIMASETERRAWVRGYTAGRRAFATDILELLEEP